MVGVEILNELCEQAYRIISKDPRALFPEFEFQRSSKGWYSSTVRKIDGSDGSSKGKVWIYDNNPGVLIDYRGSNTKSFWKYLEDVRNIEAPLNFLLEFVGLQIPVVEGEYRLYNGLMSSTHPSILKRCLSLFSDVLLDTADGVDVKSYLLERGYNEQLIRRMKLGALPPLPFLEASLKSLDVAEKYIVFFIKHMKAFVDHHPLAIPCFGYHGQLLGFTFRTIEHKDHVNVPKYRNMKNLNRQDALYNFPKGTNELLIVEGIMDSLHLSYGYKQKNVVPLMGKSLSEKQIDTLISQGISRIVLCLDNDENGRDATSHIIEMIIRQNKQVEVFVPQLPENIKDVDLLVCKFGIESFHQMISTSIGIGEYLGNKMCHDFPHPISRKPKPMPSLQRQRLFDAAKQYITYLERSPLEQRDMMRIIYRHLNDEALDFHDVELALTSF